MSHYITLEFRQGYAYFHFLDLRIASRNVDFRDWLGNEWHNAVFKEKEIALSIMSEIVNAHRKQNQLEGKEEAKLV